MLKRKCKITFIAHGETIHTQEGKISDSEKYPKLTENGNEEILKVCEYLKKRGVKNDKIYTSPATRCIQTARQISKLYKQDFEILENLTIRKFGKLNGKTYQEIFELYNKTTPSITDIETGGESEEEFNKRIIKEIEELVENNSGSRLIVVTYPIVISSVIANVLGISPENQFKMLIKTGSLTQISYFDGWASLIYSNYVPL